MKKITLSLLASLFLTAGCAKTALNINPSTNSEALQIARAAGLHQIRDQEIPQAEFNRLADSTAYNAAWAATMYFNPAPGFSSGASLALALPSLLFKNDPADSFNHVLAWMPKDLAENPKDALEKTNDILIKALEELAIQTGFTNHKTQYFKSRGRHITYVDIIDEQLQCSLNKGEFCSLTNRINMPRSAVSPKVLTKYSDQPSYFFPLRKDHTLMFVARDENLPKLDQLEMLQTYSSLLPDWIYLYIAPNTIHNATGEKLKYPFMLHQGKTLLFVKPESTN